jgi:hypothetical protein
MNYHRAVRNQKETFVLTKPENPSNVVRMSE